MRYKTEQIKEEFENFKSTYEVEQKKLYLFLKAIDFICQLCGWDEIMITDYLRHDTKHRTSYHFIDYGLAADIRVKDKPVVCYLTLYTICKAIEMVDNRLRTNFHFDDYKKKQQHIHFEIRLR